MKSIQEAAFNESELMIDSLTDITDWNKLKAYKSVTKLKVNNLSYVPQEIVTELKQLEYLEAEVCHLSWIPSPIFQLPNLKKLLFIENAGTPYGITDIPDAIEQLVNLEELNLSDNRLNFISHKISDLEKLESLTLESNYLTEGAFNFPMPRKLKKIDLQSNVLERIPDSFYELEDLEELILLRNPINEIKSDLKYLKKLKVVNLYNTPIKKEYVKDIEEEMPWCKFIY